MHIHTNVVVRAWLSACNSFFIESVVKGEIYFVVKGLKIIFHNVVELGNVLMGRFACEHY